MEQDVAIQLKEYLTAVHFHSACKKPHSTETVSHRVWSDMLMAADKQSGDT